MDLRDFIPAVKYGASLQNSKLDSGKILIGDASNLGQEITPSGAFTISTAGVATGEQGSPFTATVSVGTVASTSGVTLLTDAAVGSGRSVYVNRVIIRNSATAVVVSTGSIIWIEDSSGTPFVTINAAADGLLSASTTYHEFSGGTISTNAALYNGTGGTDGKGLRVRSSGTIAGDTFKVTAFGIIK